MKNIQIPAILFVIFARLYFKVNHDQCLLIFIVEQANISIPRDLDFHIVPGHKFELRQPSHQRIDCVMRLLPS